MDPSQDFKSTQGKIQSAVVATTKTSNQIAAEDLSFQRTSNPAVAEQLDETSERLLELATSLLKSAAKGTDLPAPDLEDADDVDTHWTRVVDVIDKLLEKADTCLDEYTGLIKRKGAPFEDAEPKPKKPKSYSALDSSMRRANILKPQLAFDVKPNNTDLSPFKPFLTQKPHAILPLEESLGTFNDENQTVQYDYLLSLPLVLQAPPLQEQPRPSTDPPSGIQRALPLSAVQDSPGLQPASKKSPEQLEARRKCKRINKIMKQFKVNSSTWSADGRFRYKHPYETEILQHEFPESMYEDREPIMYQPVETTTATFVNTFEGVLEMLEELKTAKEIAIDTEHHDFRTYGGLLSLMQISTREKDWIVDTLQPWRQKLEVLNEVFCDPNIIKVLHGAYMDIIWLQRDCGLYIVGLFDTYEACVSLSYSGRSLAYLLKRFVDFDADKKYQLADWRIRPIPEEMYYYARSDTHYLLYIFDQLRNSLVSSSDRSDEEKDLIGQVLQRSKVTALRRHEKPVYDAETGQGPVGWYTLLLKQSSGSLSREQFAVFRAIHQWRDEIARREDESPLFIMGNAVIFEISRRLPPDPKALLGMLDSGNWIARREVNELWKVVQKAQIEGVNGPSVAEVLRNGINGGVGIGAVAQAVFPRLRAPDEENVLDTKELVSEKSTLWGTVPVSTRWDGEANSSDNAKGLLFKIPWANLLEGEGDPTQKMEIALEPAPEAQPKSALADYDDGEFTLKAGRKRKAEEEDAAEEVEEADEGTPNKPETPSSLAKGSTSILMDDAIEVPDLSDDDDEEEKKARKRERKQAKKAAKQAKKAAEEQARTNGREEEEEEEEAFDYTQAKSVLNARRSNEAGAVGKDGKIFKPYALTAEGPKPARKMHGEKPGMSVTFRK